MATAARAKRNSSFTRIAFGAALLVFVPLFSALGAVALVAGESASSGPHGSANRVLGIPHAYLAAYEDAANRFELGPMGWSVLASIGEVESDHGRSNLPGVHSGQNFHGCCAGP